MHIFSFKINKEELERCLAVKRPAFAEDSGSVPSTPNRQLTPIYNSGGSEPTFWSLWVLFSAPHIRIT